MRIHTIKLALLSCSSSDLTKLELVPALELIPYWNWFHHGDELELEPELQNLKKCPKSDSGTGSGSGMTTTLVRIFATETLDATRCLCLWCAPLLG